VCAGFSVTDAAYTSTVVAVEFRCAPRGIGAGNRLGFAALVLYLLKELPACPYLAAGAWRCGADTRRHRRIPAAYPFVAFVAGWIFERDERTFARALFSGVAAEVLLFASGLTWLEP